jgi:probable rRNA maturation factor
MISEKNNMGFTPLLCVEADGWSFETDLEDLVTTALDCAFDVLEIKIDHSSEVSFLFSNDENIARLNKQWRGQDKPTNVLSFPAFPLKVGMTPKVLLGDIVLAFETVQYEAKSENKSFHHHLTHLIIHGLLHLLGYDHETESDATLMENMERKILNQLGISDPYAYDDACHV